MKPLSPDTNPGIRGTLGAGGKKRGVLSSYFAMWPQSFCETIYGGEHFKKTKEKKNSHLEKENNKHNIVQKRLLGALEYNFCSSSSKTMPW